MTRAVHAPPTTGFLLRQILRIGVRDRESFFFARLLRHKTAPRREREKENESLGCILLQENQEQEEQKQEERKKGIMVDVICLLAGVFFFTSNVLRMVFVIRIYNRAHFEYDLMTNLDVGYLREQWKFRSDNLTLGNVGMVVNAFAWFFFLVPMLQLVWVLSKCGTRQVGVHAAIAVFCMVGCFGEVMSRLLLFGFEGVVHWISSEFELDFWLPNSISNGTRDELGWKALELVFLTIEGKEQEE